MSSNAPLLTLGSRRGAGCPGRSRRKKRSNQRKDHDHSTTVARHALNTLRGSSDPHDRYLRELPAAPRRPSPAAGTAASPTRTAARRQVRPRTPSEPRARVGLGYPGMPERCPAGIPSNSQALPHADRASPRAPFPSFDRKLSERVPGRARWPARPLGAPSAPGDPPGTRTRSGTTSPTASVPTEPVAKALPRRRSRPLFAPRSDAADLAFDAAHSASQPYFVTLTRIDPRAGTRRHRALPSQHHRPRPNRAFIMLTQAPSQHSPQVPTRRPSPR